MAEMNPLADSCRGHHAEAGGNFFTAKTKYCSLNIHES
jgi:hypothetical protein